MQWNEIARILSEQSKAEYADHAAACLERNGAGKAHLVPFIRHAVLKAMADRISWAVGRDALKIIDAGQHQAYLETTRFSMGRDALEGYRVLCEAWFDAAKQKSETEAKGN